MITINFSDANAIKDFVALFTTNANVENVVKAFAEPAKKKAGRPRKVQLVETSATETAGSTGSRTKGYKHQNHFVKTPVKFYHDKDVAINLAKERGLSLTTIYKVRLPEYREESKHLPVLYAIVPNMDKAARLSVRSAYNEEYKKVYGTTLKCSGAISSKRVFKKMKAK